MKKLVLLVFVILTFQSFSQEKTQQKEWYATAGVNFINSLGSRNPLKNPGDWAFSNPFAVSVEYRGSENFAIEQTFSINKFKKGESIDSTILNKDYNYFAADTSLKYYVGHLLFNFLSRSDMYVNLGGTYFSVSEANVAGHLGIGYMYWLNKDRTFALRTQVLGKVALNNSSSGLTTNHYQYFLQVLYRFK